jgi:hypothetical protein
MVQCILRTNMGQLDPRCDPYAASNRPSWIFDLLKWGMGQYDAATQEHRNVALHRTFEIPRLRFIGSNPSPWVFDEVISLCQMIQILVCSWGIFDDVGFPPLVWCMKCGFVTLPLKGIPSILTCWTLNSWSYELPYLKPAERDIYIFLVQRKPNFLQDKNVNLVFSRVHCENIVFPGKTSCFPRMAK